MDDEIGPLEREVLQSVEARGDAICDADGATVELARSYARQIDMIPVDAAQDRTKALYLGPHLLKALAALGCTPEARGVPADDGGGDQGDDKLSALRRRRGGS